MSSARLSSSGWNSAFRRFHWSLTVSFLCITRWATLRQLSTPVLKSDQTARMSALTVIPLPRTGGCLYWQCTNGGRVDCIDRGLRSSTVAVWPKTISASSVIPQHSPQSSPLRTEVNVSCTWLQHNHGQNRPTRMSRLGTARAGRKLLGGLMIRLLQSFSSRVFIFIWGAPT